MRLAKLMILLASVSAVPAAAQMPESKEPPPAGTELPKPELPKSEEPSIGEPRSEIIELAGPSRGSGPVSIYGNLEFLFWKIKDAPLPVPLLTAGADNTDVLIGGYPIKMGVRRGARITVGVWADSDEMEGAEASFQYISSGPVDTGIMDRTGDLRLANPFINALTGKPDVNQLSVPPQPISFIDATGKLVVLPQVIYPGLWAGVQFSSRSEIYGFEGSGMMAALPDHIVALAWSPDDRLVAAGVASGPVAILDTGTGEIKHLLSGHGFGTTSIAWTDEGTVATAGQDGRVRHWDAATGAELRCLDAGAMWVERLSVSPGGKYLAAAAGKKVRLWDCNGRLVRDYTDHASTVTDIAWRPGGKELTSAAYGGVNIWSPDRDQPVRRFEWKGSVLRLAWSPDGKYLATGDQDSTVHFWIDATGEDLQMFGYPMKVRELAWDKTSRFLATGGGAGERLGLFGQGARRYHPIATGGSCPRHNRQRPGIPSPRADVGVRRRRWEDRCVAPGHRQTLRSPTPSSTRALRKSRGRATMTGLPSAPSSARLRSFACEAKRSIGTRRRCKRATPTENSADHSSLGKGILFECDIS